MKIAIINVTGGGMSGGYRKYLRNVIPRMASHHEVEALLCASPEPLNVKDWFEPISKVEFVNCKPFRFLHYNPAYELRSQLEKFSPDVIFVPIERSFRFNEVPIVTMIQNMEPFISDISGNPFSERFRNRARRIDGKKALINSNRVMAISKFVRHFLVEQWNIPDKKIGLVYHGIAMPENADVHRPDIIPKGWDGQFLFTAGSIRPARGLEDVLHALKYLSDVSLNIPGLVIVGETTSRMMKYRKILEDWIRSHNLSSKICWVGGLNEKEMEWFYKNCHVFVMSSRVEACPNIALEAMANLCLCIAADNPPLPEIFKDAAIYYPLKDGKALAEKIQTVLTWDDNQRKVMSEKAKKQAAKFSWDVCAEKTVAVLAKAAGDFNR